MDQPHDNVRWQQRWLLGALLVVATFIAYQPAWRAGFIWDDDAYVTRNALLTAPDGLRRIWFSTDSPSQYFPLVYTTFRAERTLLGLLAGTRFVEHDPPRWTAYALSLVFYQLALFSKTTACTRPAALLLILW